MGKKIILLSKHKKNIKESLLKYTISDLLFDEIILLDEQEEKADYIINTCSIFIDDSFAERKKVFEKLHIPTFSLDAVESLFV